jgi:membrane protein YdbS with pleckstrin-like domain
MGYAEKQLVAGEEIIYRARYHWIFYRRAIEFALLSAVLAAAALKLAPREEGVGLRSIAGWSAVALFAVAVVTFAFLLIRAYADEFVVTDRRVLHKIGFFSHETRQCPLARVQDITVNQSVWGRLLGYGDLFIETASEAGQMIFPAIVAPEKLRTAIWTHVGTGGMTATPGPAATGGAAAANRGATAEERFAKLQELKTKGLVTPEEFEQKRREIVRDL